jgi:predicted Zn-dependent protease
MRAMEEILGNQALERHLHEGSEIAQDQALGGSLQGAVHGALEGALQGGVRTRIAALRSKNGHLSARLVVQRQQRLEVSRGVPMPVQFGWDAGVMLTVLRPGAIGYAATSDLSESGLLRALASAEHWAGVSQRCGLLEGWTPQAPTLSAVSFEAPVSEPLPARSQLMALLAQESGAMKCDAKVVGWRATLNLTELVQNLWWDGHEVSVAAHHFVEPNLEVTAADGAFSQTRTLGGRYNGFCQQGGFEVVRRSGLPGGGRHVAEQALELLQAPNCPTGTLDVLLMPDQMMLQIHESIGHPLELDRILGDERNFAGTSFVTPQMFGQYRYGSDLLNVCVDPTLGHEFAAYRIDDDATPASRVLLIERGILQRPLGGALSQARAALQGYALQTSATARASGWHRPPIDRMANLNVEPGDSSLEQMIGSVRRGVLMRTNASWSIDDSRNKFQFGCEWGQMIENGQLTRVVRNPNYRGVSATFWRSLAAVGDRTTFEVMGTPFCGKGEPGQVIRVGHAAPACLFRDIEVFGAAQ